MASRGNKYRTVTFDYRADGVIVLLDGMHIGECWLTPRGACYDHNQKRIRLGADELAVIVNEMRKMEGGL